MLITELSPRNRQIHIVPSAPQLVGWRPFGIKAVHECPPVRHPEAVGDADGDDHANIGIGNPHGRTEPKRFAFATTVMEANDGDARRSGHDVCVMEVKVNAAQYTRRRTNQVELGKRRRVGP